MALTSTTSDLPLSVELNSFPMPSEAYVPVAWYLGAHMLKCILKAKSSEEKKSSSEGKEQQQKSVPKTGKSGKSTTASRQKVRKNTCSPSLKKPTGNSNPSSQESKSVSKRKDTLRSESRSSSRLGKQGHKTRHSTITESKRTKTMGSTVEASSKHISVGNGVKGGDEPSKGLKRSAAALIARQQNEMETIKDGMQSEGESLKRLCQIDSQGNGSGASWLQNPVYSSRGDGESNESKTDRSELSLPWITMTSLTKTNHDTTKTLSTRILEEVKEKTVVTGKVQIKAYPIRTQQQTSDMSSTSLRSVNLRKVPTTTPKKTCHGERILSDTDLAIRKTIERKLGKSLAEVDPTSLKVISEERMKELTQKYGGKCPSGARPLTKESAAALIRRKNLRTKEFNDNLNVVSARMNRQHEKCQISS